MVLIINPKVNSEIHVSVVNNAESEGQDTQRNAIMKFSPVSYHFILHLLNCLDIKKL